MSDKAKVWTMTEVVAALFSGLQHEMWSHESLQENLKSDQNSEEDIHRRTIDLNERGARAGVYLDLLDRVFDHGWAFTKDQVKLIVESKKAIHPTLYEKKEPVAGSS